MQLLPFILSFILWLFMPWLGVFSFLANKIKYQKYDLQCVILIGFTVLLYQISLPMPYDLEVTKLIYLETAKNPMSSWALGWIARDPLSYGILNLLTYIAPSLPILFYLINFIILFGSLWFIYNKLKIQEGYQGFLLLVGVFLLLLNFQETHHYLRQTTALFIFISALFLQGYKKYLLIIAAILWHGSTVLYLPSLLILTAFRKKNYGYYAFCLLLLISLVLSGINIYDIFKTESVLKQAFHQFSFLDRFLTYFQHPRHASFYETYKENGNLDALVSLVLGLMTIIYSFFKKQKIDILCSLLMSAILWIGFFRYHVLAYERVQYVFTILLLLYWINELSQFSLKKKDLLSVGVLCLCFVKITFFTWGLEMRLYNKPLYLVSPIEMLLKFPDWPINQ